MDGGAFSRLRRHAVQGQIFKPWEGFIIELQSLLLDDLCHQDLRTAILTFNTHTKDDVNALLASSLTARVQGRWIIEN